MLLSRFNLQPQWTNIINTIYISRLVRIYAVFHKEDNFHGFLFAFLHIKPLIQRDVSYRKESATCRANQSLLEKTSIDIEDKIISIRIPSPESVSIHLKNNIFFSHFQQWSLTSEFRTNI